MRAACIDIGSNTTRLLVADCAGGALQEVHQERVFTRIGHGLTRSGAIPEAKIEEVVEVVRAQMAIAERLHAARIHGVATAAIRTAANGEGLIDAVVQRTSLRIRVLSGEEEARLAFRGAAAMHPLAVPADPVAVIDVGGGSSEIVVGTIPDRVRWWVSLGIGSATITEQVLRSDPPAAAELSTARREVAGALAGLEPPRPRLALAVGGSATTLARLCGLTLDDAALERALARLVAAPAGVMAARAAIDPQRARLLPAGLIILQQAAGLLGAPLEVGRGGIREGVLLEAAA